MYNTAEDKRKFDKLKKLEKGRSVMKRQEITFSRNGKRPKVIKKQIVQGQKSLIKEGRNWTWQILFGKKESRKKITTN